MVKVGPNSKFSGVWQFFVVVILLGAIWPAALQANPLDFDGDGVTDPTFKINQNGNSSQTIVNHVLRSNDAKHVTNEFGSHREGDFIAHANYDEDNQTEIAIVRINKNTNRLVWRVQDGNGGADHTINFGVAGNTIIIGCDFDGNGVDDIAFIRDGQLHYRNFYSEGTRIIKIGKKKYKSYSCGDVNGDGRDELVTLRTKRSRRGGRGKTTVFDAWSGKVAGGTKIVRSLHFGSKAKSGILIADINGDGIDEYGYYRGVRLVFKLADQKIAYKLGKFRKHAVTRASLPASNKSIYDGVVFQGRDKKFYFMNFLDLNQQEVGFSDKKGKGARVLIKGVNFFNTRLPASGGEEEEGGGQSTPAPGRGLGSVCPSTQRLPPGNLYKPAADSPDSRSGKPVLLLRGGSKNGNRSTLSIYASDGSEICGLAYKAASDPNVNGAADHYFSGWPGGCSKTGSQIASLAQAAAGSRNIYIEWKSGTCLGPINPTAREGN